MEMKPIKHILHIMVSYYSTDSVVSSIVLHYISYMILFFITLFWAQRRIENQTY